MPNPQDGLADADTGKIIDANPIMTALLGYSHKEFVGKELWEVGLFRDKDRQKGIENPVLDQSAGIIERQAGQLALLVDELLEVSRITTGRIQLHQQLIAFGVVVENAVETVRSLIIWSNRAISTSC